jgi:HSP20 family protein
MTTALKPATIFPAFSSLWDDFFNRELDGWPRLESVRLPSVNVRETDKEYLIEFAAPGMQKNDFHVEIEKDIITISSEKQEERAREDLEGKYLRKEFSYNSFRRSFALPENTNRENIQANYKDGILTLTVLKTKTESKASAKAIAVK